MFKPSTILATLLSALLLSAPGAFAEHSVDQGADQSGGLLAAVAPVNNHLDGPERGFAAFEKSLPPDYAPWLARRLELWREELHWLESRRQLTRTELSALEKRIEQAEVLHRLQTRETLSPDQERALLRQVHSVETLLERLLTGIEPSTQSP